MEYAGVYILKLLTLGAAAILFLLGVGCMKVGKSEEMPWYTLAGKVLIGIGIVALGLWISLMIQY